MTGLGRGRACKKSYVCDSVHDGSSGVYTVYIGVYTSRGKGREVTHRGVVVESDFFFFVCCASCEGQVSFQFC